MPATLVDSGGTAFTGAGITSQATASVTPAAGELWLLVLNISRDAVTGLAATGNGLTWVLVGTYTQSNYVTVAVFRAMGSGSAGAVTASWNEGSFDVNYHLVKVTGVDTSGTNGSGAIVQTATGGAESVGTGTVSITLGAAITSGNLALSAWSQRGSNAAANPRASWTELADTNVAANGSLETQTTTTADTAASATGASGLYNTIAGLVVEIKAAAASHTNPTATISSAVVTGRSLAVQGSATLFDGATVSTWDWNWGDGTAHGSTQNASHDYAAPGGTYTITLTVTDSLAAQGTASTSKTTYVTYAYQLRPVVSHGKAGTAASANRPDA